MRLPLPQTFSSLSLLLLIFARLQAQIPVAHEDPDPTRWINYNQVYFKIAIAQAGIYRLTATDLQKAGVPLGQFDPTYIQLIHRGVEQAIYVEGEADHIFDSADFIEFYGRGNDGAQDSLLYHPRRAQPHSHYSLFNDTTAYFLTWSATRQLGKRICLDTATALPTEPPEAFHWADEEHVFTDTYPGWAAGLPHGIETSYYDPGEGYTGLIQSSNRPYPIPLTLVNPARDGPKPQLELLVVGRSYGYHQVNCSIDSTNGPQRPIDSVRFVGYTNAHLAHPLTWAEVTADDRVTLLTRSCLGKVDDYSVSYVCIRYPQRFIGTGQAIQYFRLRPNPKGKSVLLIRDLPPTTRFWDISDPMTARQLSGMVLPNHHIRLVVSDTETARTILACTQVRTVPTLRPVTFVDWRQRKPTYLIISHGLLHIPVCNASRCVNAIQEYARYRASSSGGGHDTLTATMQQLFDQYSYGERHPLAIRRFARQILQQCHGMASPYLLLIGRSRSTPGIRHDPQQATLDLVMTAGFPGSDVAHTASLVADEPHVPALPTGRITAETPQEVLHYLAKVKVYERENGNASWRTNWLHLAGGQTMTERALFRRLVDSYRTQVRPSPLNPQVTTLAKHPDHLKTSIQVAEWINNGVGLLTFFGHSSLTTTDIPIGLCSDDTLGYHNQGRYPFLLLNGCALGNFFYGRPTLATDWVLAPNRGAIAAIAQSHTGYVDVLNTYTSTFYQLLSDSTWVSRSIGQLQQETIRRVLTQNPGGRTLANAQQMVLQGDPAIQLFPRPKTDYSSRPPDSNHNPMQLTVYPNPSSGSILFSYHLQGTPLEPSSLTLTDLSGHVVRRLTLPAQAGLNEWCWNGCTDAGLSLPAGVYVYSLITGDESPTPKSVSGRVVLLR